MTDTQFRLLESVAAELHCDVAEVSSRLEASPTFAGHDLLPAEIIDAWNVLHIEAKAVSVLYAKNLNEENENSWDRYER